MHLAPTILDFLQILCSQYLIITSSGQGLGLPVSIDSTQNTGAPILIGPFRYCHNIRNSNNYYYVSQTAFCSEKGSKQIKYSPQQCYTKHNKNVLYFKVYQQSRKDFQSGAMLNVSSETCKHLSLIFLQLIQNNRNRIKCHLYVHLFPLILPANK